MFTPDSGKADKPALIPDKTIAFTQVRFQEIKNAKTSGGEYARLEFIITDGPYEGRRVYSIVMNPTDARNKNEAAEAMLDSVSMKYAAVGAVSYTAPEILSFLVKVVNRRGQNLLK